MKINPSLLSAFLKTSMIIVCLFILLYLYLFSYTFARQSYANTCPRPLSDASTEYDKFQNRCWSWGDIGWNVEGEYEACSPEVKCPNGFGNGAYGNTCETKNGNDCHAGHGATGVDVPGCIMQDPNTSIVCADTNDFLVKVIDKITKQPLSNIKIKFHYEDNPPGNTIGKEQTLTTDRNGLIMLDGTCSECTYTGGRGSFLYPGDHVVLTPQTSGYIYSPSQIGDENDWKNVNGGANIEMNTTWSCGTIIETIDSNNGRNYKPPHPASHNAACLFEATVVSNPTLTNMPNPTDTPTPSATVTPTASPTPSTSPVLYSISGNVFNDLNVNQRYDPPKETFTGGNNGSISVLDSANKKIVQINNIASTYDTGKLIPAGTYTVQYALPNTGWYMSYPLFSTPPSFPVTIPARTPCNPLYNDEICTNGNIANLNFGILQALPWYQSICGDIREDSGITNHIPLNATCGANPPAPYMSITNAICTNSPGIVFSGNTDPIFGLGFANSLNRISGTSNYPESFTPDTTSTIRTSYAYMLTSANESGITPIDITPYCGNGGLFNCKLQNLTHGLYIAPSQLNLTGYTIPSGQNIIILVAGDFHIQGNLIVPSNATFIVSALGNIYVESTVGNADQTVTSGNIEGLFSTDKSFIVKSAGTCPDLRLNIEGSIVTNAGLTGGSFQNQRDLCNGNASCPSVAITQRPDFLLNAPSFIKHAYSLFQEIIP